MQGLVRLAVTMRFYVGGSDDPGRQTPSFSLPATPPKRSREEMNPHFFTAPCLFSDDRLFFCDAYFSGIGLRTGRGLSDIEDHALVAGGEGELLLFLERAMELTQDTACLL